MSGNIQKTILIVLKVFTALVAGYYIILFLYIAVSRISFPFPFDWVEGAVMVQANRVLLGQKLFVEPGAAYIPLIYQPLYFYVAALFTKLLGLGLMPARLLSTLASCGCMLMVFLLTSKASGARFSGLISAGVFAATNGVVWTWFDFAKVDMLCIFFFLAGLYFLRQDNNRGAIIAGLLFTLSFFTKQTVTLMILPVFVYTLFTQRRQALIFMGIFALLSCAGIILLNYESNGWYAFYVFTLPSHHPLNTSPRNVMYVVTSMLQPVLLVLGITLFSILTNLKKFICDDQYRFFIILAGSTLVTSIFGALIVGSTRNAFIPAYAFIAIVFGLGLQYLQAHIEGFLSSGVKLVCFTVLLGICLLQFSFLQYKAQDHIPTAQDFKRGNALIDYLRDTDGEFLIPTQNHLALYANKNVYYHASPLGELLVSKALPELKKTRNEIRDLVQSKKVKFVFMEEPVHSWLNMTCQKEDVFKSGSKFVPTFYKMICY